MAIKDWIGFPEFLEAWRHRGDAALKEAFDQINTNLADIALNTAHRERQEPTNGYLWESDTSTEEIRVQGEQGSGSNRLRIETTTAGGGTEGLEVWVNGVRALFIGDNNIYLYSDDGGTELIGIDRVNDRVDLIADAAVTLGTNITNFGGAFLGGNYRVDNSGQVTLEGLLRNSTGGNITNPYTLCTIPSTYAPQGDLLFNQNAGSSANRARIDVDTSGNVIFKGTTPLPNNQFISLSGISWYYI